LKGEPTHLYFAPAFGVTPSEFHKDLWYQRARIPRLLFGVIHVIQCLAILVQCRLVTDGPTDKHTTTAYTAPPLKLRPYGGIEICVLLLLLLSRSVQVKIRPHSPWFDSECRSIRRNYRHLERHFRRSYADVDRLAWTAAMREYQSV